MVDGEARQIREYFKDIHGHWRSSAADCHPSAEPRRETYSLAFPYLFRAPRTELGMITAVSHPEKQLQQSKDCICSLIATACPRYLRAPPTPCIYRDYETSLLSEYQQPLPFYLVKRLLLRLASRFAKHQLTFEIPAFRQIPLLPHQILETR